MPETVRPYRESAKDIADHYGVHIQTVYAWAKRGCPVRQVGGVMRFNVLDVDQWVQEQSANDSGPEAA